ncbi:glycosyltransferase family 2 protein [Longimicrobium sp.]|uniref:glycosyltransferase family 2 protein n=1 Tax=Longimicrobium sp. TaxID=2029185 RepID=UPI002ED7F01D
MPAGAVRGGEPVTAPPPLVSVSITAHNRPDDLRLTLRRLGEQTHRPLEVIVVDDASDVELEPVVREEWPDAVYRRNPRNLGAHASRSWAMQHARGEYILTLDDDSFPVDPHAVGHAVARFEREPAVGVLAFQIHEGLEPPDPAVAPQPERYVHTFINCGQMMRAETARAVGGFRDFFVHYAEEGELALRVLDHGWRIVLFPSVVHHRMSPIGRSNARIWAYIFRNTLWTAVLNFPFPRVLVELAWKLFVNGIEAVRIGQPRLAAWALGSFLRGLPRALRLRRPMSREALRVYDVVRFREVATAEELGRARPPTVRERLHWLREVWLRRPRARPFWDRRPGRLGRSAYVVSDAEAAAGGRARRNPGTGS